MASVAGDPRDRVTDVAFQIAPELLDAELAGPWRRGSALLIDFVLASMVSALGGAGIAGALAGFFLYRLIGSRSMIGPGWIRKPIAFVMAVTVFGVINESILSDDDNPYPVEVSESAVVGANVPDWARVMVHVGGKEVPLSKFMDDVADEAAKDPLVLENQALKRANEALRAEVESPSLLSSVRALAEDLGLTLGWVGAYFTLTLAWFGGYTPGKRMMGVRVYRLDGSAISLWWSFERFGGYAAGVATGLLGFAQVFWDPNRQAIQDRIAGTVVVRMRTKDVPRYVDIQSQGTT